MAEQVELHDVQGIIIHGYGKMSFAHFLLLHFNEVDKAKNWLKLVSEDLTNAEVDLGSVKTCVNIAFTNYGVQKLGITNEEMSSFSREFEEGMVTKHRQRMFGDFDESDPENWEWGGVNDSEQCHAVLLLYAENEEDMNGLMASQKSRLTDANIDILKDMVTNLLPDRKEHFGFRDGIGQPFVKGVGKDGTKQHDANQINVGEFLFGYLNEYEKYTISPNIEGERDRENLLKKDMNNPAMKDLGRNGSMLVFRQMEQNVKSFWDFLEKEVNEQKIVNTSDSAVKLASKMVGRWPSGAPLTKCPVQDNSKYKYFDNFGYAANDFDGMKCPIGSHIRRTNPRDNFVRNSSNKPEKDIENSQKFMKRFRIIRRGRAYGEPLSPAMDPQAIVANPDDGKKRGLHFLCFNSNIGRQFELMQQTWVVNPKFSGLYEDPDPIIGYPEVMGKGTTTTFTEPAQPIRKKVNGIPRFVTIKGGAYFFMPGINGVKFLAFL